MGPADSLILQAYRNKNFNADGTFLASCLQVLPKVPGALLTVRIGHYAIQRQGLPAHVT